MLHSGVNLGAGVEPCRITMLFMYSTARLGFWRGIVVVCRFWTGAHGARGLELRPP